MSVIVSAEDHAWLAAIITQAARHDCSKVDTFREVALGQGTQNKPGSRNKITEEVRVALLKAFHAVGEADYLEEVARTHPAVFCALLGKILPTEMATDGPITQEVVLKWMTPEMAKARGFVGPAEKMTTYEIGQQARL